MRINAKPLFIILSAAYLSGCGVGITDRSYDKNSVQAKIMNDLIASGEERVARTGQNEMAVYRAKDFTLNNQKVTAHVVTYIKEDGMGTDPQYEDGVFWNMEPHICFELFENKKNGTRIIYVGDKLTNNPATLEDIMMSFDSANGKFIIPEGMPKDSVKIIKNQGLYSMLIAEYKKQFLK